jgi:S-DNA-T family DNA segregation ATPase FtsK/SpoIIIE
MAKKKRRTQKRKTAKKEELQGPNYFWRQVFVFAMVVAALFLLVGGFGWGGILPVKLFSGASWLLGLVAYLLPFVIIFLAVQKYKHEEFMIPFMKLFASFLFLVCLAGMVHVFIDRSESALAASQGTYGGEIGHLASSGLLLFLNSTTAFILFFVLAWLAFMMMFGIAPKKMLSTLANLFRYKKSSDTDLAELKAKDDSFQVHEGVPVEHNDGSRDDSRNPKGLRAAAAKLAPNEDHAALTAENDPNWKFPDVSLLNQKQDKANPGDTKARAEIIKGTLAEFGLEVAMESANVGPRVTQYTLLPSPGQKLSKIATYEPNMAYELAAESIRIEAPIPGKRAVGIEVPNLKSATVRLSSIISSKEWASDNQPLIFAVGKDISGHPVIASIDKMPHLLIAGQTGSGKSVMINTLLTSLVYRNSPSELKLILVDPKQVELTPYNNIPHLLTPVITEPEKCISALKWSVAEMERRLKAFAEYGKRNIAEYNHANKEESMPYIVIVIDELYDYMMAAGRDIEALVARIAAKSRAAGIHLILATQRPSVDVITGLIKANVPSRVAFTVVSHVDSRTIIDQTGAEKLLGLGDMLYKTTDMSKPIRLQGALIEKDEIDKVNDFLRAQREPQYNDEVISMPVQLTGRGGAVIEHIGSGEDEAWNDAVRVVIDSGKASTSLLQRRLRIGYGRASRIIDEMEDRGIVGPASGSKAREVLVNSMDDVFGSDEDEGFEEPISDDSRDQYLT